MNKVKGYRNMINATQEDFANLLGVSRQTYHLKEKGCIQFKDKEKVIIRDFLKQKGITVTIEQLFF